MPAISVEPRGGSVLSRRAFLRTSLVTGGALSLPSLLRQRAEATAAGRRPRDTAVIQVWLGGGPSHVDMYDLKPKAPDEIRGPYRPIASNVPGIEICELLPRQARIMDRLAIVRSLHHGSDLHAEGIHWMQTGHFAPLQNAGPGQPTHPAIGSVTSLLRGPNGRGMIPYVHIAPDPMGFPIFPRILGPASLGSSHEPLLVDSARKEADPDCSSLDNLIGRTEFRVPHAELPAGMTIDRLDDRARLLSRLDRIRRRWDSRHAAVDRLDQFQRQAFDLLTSGAARTAFDLSREEPAVCDRYGRNAWGQGLLLCRRLVEAGVTFVTLNTDSFSGQWDNHVRIKPALDEMLPVYDQMLTALVNDLVERGLYERVLVLVWGEFGRTPRINDRAGRDHWGRAGFCLLGGAGVRGGVAVGATTRGAEEPKDRPVSPSDILATVYDVLGIDPQAEYNDAFGRPIKVLESGEPIGELLNHD